MILFYILIGLITGCSTTKHLPNGEVLYTGQRKTIIHNPSQTPVGEIAIEEIEGAITETK